MVLVIHVHAVMLTAGTLADLAPTRRSREVTSGCPLESHGVSRKRLIALALEDTDVVAYLFVHAGLPILPTITGHRQCPNIIKQLL